MIELLSEVTLMNGRGGHGKIERSVEKSPLDPQIICDPLLAAEQKSITPLL